MMSKYPLTDDEALLLDGKVGAEAQALIDSAKERIALRASGSQELSDKDRKFIVDVVAEARKKGLLRKGHAAMRHCPCCGKEGGYAVYARTSRNHRKGEPNRDKPKMLSGVTLADDFIRITGYPRLATCAACYSRLVPHLKLALEGLEVELPEDLQDTRRWRRHRLMKCEKCSWDGLEAEMGLRRTLMGDGMYPATCPKCQAQNVVFGPEIVKFTGSYKLLPLEGAESP
jgi:hypothetical protein